MKECEHESTSVTTESVILYTENGDVEKRIEINYCDDCGEINHIKEVV